MAAEGDSIDGLLSEFSEPESRLEQLFPEEAAFADALTQFSQKEEEISLEDAAWVDSCLGGESGDPQLSEDGWSALRDALFDALTDRIVTSATLDSPISANYVVDEAMSESGDPEEEHDDPQANRGEKHSSLDLKEEGEESSDGGDSGDEAESEKKALEDIFRVWDFETPDEEDELIKQLNRALTQSGVSEDEQSLLDDPSADALDDKQLDELVAGECMKKQNRRMLVKIIHQDFEIPDEEDELIKLLNRALAQSEVSNDEQSPLNDLSATALDEKQLVELITGIADLSLFFPD